MHPNPKKVIYTMSDRNVDIKGLNVPMGSSESVNWRTDNTMANRKWTKEQTTIYKTLPKKTEDRVTRTTRWEVCVCFDDICWLIFNNFIQ